MPIGEASNLKFIPKEWFDLYLRTGPVPWDATDSAELKFNPWHDLATGRFTFSGLGGSAGGGGASGGGGGPPLPKKAGRASPRKQPSIPPVLPPSRSVASTSAASKPPGHVVISNGYSYTLDPADRTTSVTGTLTLTLTPTQQRSRRAQATTGGSDRLTTDDGGHYIASRFNGPTDTFNHFAQDANFNRGGYRVLEDRWAQDVKAGKKVYVAITPTYTGASRRPATIDVVYWVNGQSSSKLFANSSKGTSHGK